MKQLYVKFIQVICAFYLHRLDLYQCFSQRKCLMLKCLTGRYKNTNSKINDKINLNFEKLTLFEIRKIIRYYLVYNISVAEFNTRKSVNQNKRT